MRKVLLATRPLVPPWDEASKNFAYFLGTSIEDHALTLLTTHEKLTGLPSHTTQEPLYTSGHFGIGAKMRLVSYLRSQRSHFDITHYLFTPTRLNSQLIQRFARPTRGKTIQTVATLREDLYTEEELRSLLFADRLVASTEATRMKLARLGFSNVERIYPGIDLTHYRPGQKSAEVMRTYGLSPEDFFIVYPGEYSRLGATDFLVETLIEHFKTLPDSRLRFLFACRIKNEEDRKKREALRVRLREAELDRCILLENEHSITDMRALYQTADVVAFPVGDLKGKFDVPLVIIEAYACGKTVLLSDLPNFKEFSGSQFSVTIPRLDSQAFLSKVAYLKDNPAVREQLGAQARVFVEKHFDLKQTAQSYSALYNAL